jgi:hypothetical protein
VVVGLASFAMAAAGVVVLGGAAPPTEASGVTFGALTPARLFESRPGESTVDGVQQGVGRRRAGQVTEVQVGGRAKIPSNAVAAVLNVTAISPDDRGFVTVFPCGANRPGASTLNYFAGAVVANGATVKLGTGGKVCVYTHRAMHLVVDVTGFIPTGAPFGALTPARLFESRAGESTIDGAQQGVGRRKAGQVTEVRVGGRAKIPADALAAVINVTAINPADRGFVTVFPCGAKRPGASTLNYTAGAVVANGTTVTVGNRGKICVYTHRAMDLVVDVTGYFPRVGNLPTPGALQFNFDKSVGLALRDPALTAKGFQQTRTGEVPQQETSSNLFQVDSTGALSPAITSGTALIERFLIAPNGKVYVLFLTPTLLNEFDSKGCLLAEVDPATGLATCIDDTLASVIWPCCDGNNPAIQFDSSGRIYYLGQTSDGRTVLRRYSGGSVTNLINDNISIQDFLVLPDGSVLLNGLTRSNQLRWVRKVAPSGGLQTLFNDSKTNFMLVFPDRNVYMGVAEAPGRNPEIRRYLTSIYEFDQKPWVGIGDAYFDPELFCTVDAPVEAICAIAPRIVNAITTSQGSVYVLARGYSAPNALIQYYPVLAVPTTLVRQVSVAVGVAANIVLAGTNVNGRHTLTLLNTSTGRETVLISQSNEIEIYHLDYVAADNDVMFDGLRFSDNRYVIGRVNLSTGAVSVTSIGSGQLVDFATF